MTLVSVLVPAYHAASTLPMAIASLVAQTLEDWECVAVDDGSRDETASVLRSLAAREPRLRVISLSENRGRGYARATALAAARGKYIAFLDADDWCYPDRLATQLAFLEREPSCGLVSSGMAIVDGLGGLAAVRAEGSGCLFRRPRGEAFMPPGRVWFAPSMVRREAARRIGFDSRLRFVEDYNFLGHMATVCDIAMLGDPLYAYTELTSVTLPKILSTLVEQDAVLATASNRPLHWRLRQRASVRAKAMAYRALFRAGLGDAMLRRRSRVALPGERRHFGLARRCVLDALPRVWGDR